MEATKNEAKYVTVTVARRAKFEFLASGTDATWAPFTIDEDPPLGEGRGPSPAALLGAAVGDCLSSSLLFCLSKAHVAVAGLTTSATAKIERSENGRLRIAGIRVVIRPSLADAEKARFDRCAPLFEDFCTVTQSVREGIDVDVEVVPDFTKAPSAVSVDGAR